MRKIKIVLISTMALLFVCLSSQDAQAQATCNTTTEIRGGEEWPVLQSDCRVMASYPLPRNLDFNGNCIIGVNPPNVRFSGPVVRNTFSTGKFINLCVSTEELDDRGNCIDLPGSPSRLVGARFLNMSSLEIQDGRITNINFGANRQCNEGFGLWIENFEAAPFRNQAQVKNVKIDGFQRAGAVIRGNVDYYEVNTDVGKCSSADVQNCTGIQYGASPYSATYVNSKNSKFAQNNNISGFGGLPSVSVLFATTMVSEITNCQLRDGNSNSGIYVAVESTGPIIDNCKISESGDDGPIVTDRGIDDQGFGTQIRNMDPQAKIRGYTDPIYRRYPVSELGAFSTSQTVSEAGGNAAIIE